MGRDGWIALGLLAFSGWLYSNLGKIPPNPLVPIGPAFYPRLLLLLIIALSLGLLLQSLLGHRKAAQEKPPLRDLLKKYQPTLLSFSLFLLYVLLLPRLGFLISTMLFVGTLQWFLGPPSWRRLPGAALLGVGSSLTAYAVFELYLRVLLPSGSWLR